MKRTEKDNSELILFFHIKDMSSVHGYGSAAAAAAVSDIDSDADQNSPVVVTTLEIDFNDSKQALTWNGESLLCAAWDGKLADITTIRIKNSWKTWTTRGVDQVIQDDGFSSFSDFLSILLKGCPNANHLELISLRYCDMFSDLEEYPPLESCNKISSLYIRYCDVSDEDIKRLGPCFPNATHLTWYLNSFNEVAYEMNVDPYFQTVHFENDDGWWPGCELWGDGQLTQDKNSRKYY